MADVTVKRAPAEEKPAKESTPMRSRPGFSTMLTPFSGGLFNLNPFALMKEFANEVDRNFFNLRTPESSEAWMPVIECKRQNGGLVISAELPGLIKDDVHVEITDEALIVEGDRTREDVEEKEGFYRSERAYGHFYRYIRLPEGAEADKAKAELKDGVLTVTVPAPEKPKENRRQIPIQDKK